MADENLQDNFGKIYTLAVTPGVKRDGTKFESTEFTDGVWNRFQRGRPKKIGGYRQLFTSLTSIPRGLIASPQNGVNYVFTGDSQGLQVFTTGTNSGLGAGPYTVEILTGYSEVTVVSNTTTQFVVSGNLTGVYATNTEICFEQEVSPTIYTVSSSSYNSGSNQTTVVFSPALGSGVTVTSVFLVGTQFEPDNLYSWQFDIQYSPAGGRLNLLASPAINLQNIDSARDTQVLIGGLTPNSQNKWQFSGLSDSAGQNPTYEPIVVDGGVCCLYPYIFVYGSNGFIANNHVSSDYFEQSPYDWNGPTANQINMSASKIVKGMPMRGGTNSPSGLFWATDSLIRVSFTGQAPLYWRYDIVGSQISIMSSNSVVEMGGIYYWMGVDRFYQYNGNVSVLPNDKNVNWLFDNLNYSQRQKVWATKVPRYNEIWFFYPRGTATECTDAIIYNVKDNIWYDAGSAVGAQRSCGWTTEILPQPIWADWNLDVSFSYPISVIPTPAGAFAPFPSQFYCQGDQTQIFAPGNYVSTQNTVQNNTLTTYRVLFSSFTFNVTMPQNGYTFVILDAAVSPTLIPGNQVFRVGGGYTLWEHEYGVNKITANDEEAIYSSVTTADISWIGGTPSQDTATSVNRRMHIRRFEPDFKQVGEIEMTVIGRKFAASQEIETSGPYVFDANTGKIDLRVEHRLVQLQFVSNTINGDYEMGRNMITAEYGDERP